MNSAQFSPKPYQSLIIWFTIWKFDDVTISSKLETEWRYHSEIVIMNATLILFNSSFCVLKPVAPLVILVNQCNQEEAVRYANVATIQLFATRPLDYARTASIIPLEIDVKDAEMDGMEMPYCEHVKVYNNFITLGLHKIPDVKSSIFQEWDLIYDEIRWNWNILVTSFICIF